MMFLLYQNVQKMSRDKKGGIKSGRLLSTDDYGARAIACYRCGVVNMESAIRARNAPMRNEIRKRFIIIK